MRIAAVVFESMPSSIYRSLVPMQALAHRGHTVHVEERHEVANPRMLLDFDVVHFCRSCHLPMQVIARHLRRAGVGVVWDNDDDIRTIPAGHAMQSGMRGSVGQHIVSDMSSMMRLSHVVTAPTEALAERYRRLSRGGDVRVIENFLPPTFERPERVMPHGSAVRIAWLSSFEHQSDLEQLRLRETLEHLLTRHAHVEVVGIGLDLGLSSRRYEHVPFSVYAALPTLLAHVDIGLAPIADVEFNRIRSDVKVKEYAAVGVPWLASPIGPYAGLGEEQGGRLVADDQWQAELERLIADADERRRLGFRGRQWAEGERIEGHVDRWEQVLEEAVARAAAPGAVR
jgi:glycosyltransferase involved in cell wall biosynthesis